jgi:hypothetical protein
VPAGAVVADFVSSDSGHEFVPAASAPNPLDAAIGELWALQPKKEEHHARLLGLLAVELVVVAFLVRLVVKVERHRPRS